MAANTRIPSSWQWTVSRFARLHAYLLLVLALYLLLSIVYGRTLLPASDEGLFADPAYNLANGNGLRSTMMEQKGQAWEGINRHIYFMPPLHFVVLAQWYRVFGAGIISTRLVSTLFGLGWLIVWYVLLRPVWGRRAAWLLLGVALDPIFLVASARGRMDMECAALGMSGIALYLILRSSSVGRSIIFSTTLVALSCLSHPNGVFYVFELVLVVMVLDRGRLTKGLIGLAFIPFVLAALLWGAYIFEDPRDAVTQLTANVLDGGRLSALRSPISGIAREVQVRYGSEFGFGPTAVGSYAWLKSGPLLLAVLAVLFWAVDRRFRQYARIGPIIACGLLNAAFLAVIDGQKRPYYLIHVIPMITICLVAWLFYAYEELRLRRTAVSLALACCCVDAILHLSRFRANEYHREYLPAVQFLKTHVPLNASIFAPPEYGFALGFGPSARHDKTFGFYSGRRADVLVTLFGYRGNLEWTNEQPRAIAEHIRKLLRDYTLSYDTTRVQIYIRRTQP